MPHPRLAVAPVNLGAHVLNDGNRTVAIVTPQGYIDWLLVSPDDKGQLVKKIYVETHLCYVLGLKLVLHLPGVTETVGDIRFEILGDGEAARLSGDSHSKDGKWQGRHEATIAVNPRTGRFEWDVVTTLTCVAREPVPIKWIEYNNVYPSGTGRCMLFTPQKQFDRTLMVDRDGVVWHFPHQHTMHYTRKINLLNFAAGTMAGFFGEALNPVVLVDESTLEPDWGICDMYYDLHCGARVAAPVAPGTVHRWRYRVKYLDAKESASYLSNARYVPITATDYREHDHPRLALGQNDFKEAIAIDEPDDASCFRTRPPQRVWDRQAGPAGRGALRVTNDTAQETVWGAEPPTQIPAATKFRLTALVKTQGVTGKGLFLRVRYHTFRWTPEPHVEWVKTLESEPVTGSTDWVQVETPVLHVLKKHLDYLVWIEVVLDGQGVGWVADVGVHLQGVEAEVPAPVDSPVRA